MHADIVYIVCDQTHNIHFHAFLYKFSISFFMIPNITAQMSPLTFDPHTSHIIKAFGFMSADVLLKCSFTVHCAQNGII